MTEALTVAAVQAGVSAVEALRERRRKQAEEVVDEVLDRHPEVTDVLDAEARRDIRVEILRGIELRDDRDIVAAVLAMQSGERTGDRLTVATWALVVTTVALVIATVVLIFVTAASA